MIHNVVEFGNISCLSFESFGESHFRPTFDAGAVRRCIAIVRAIHADCLATKDHDRRLTTVSRYAGYFDVAAGREAPRRVGWTGLDGRHS